MLIEKRNRAHRSFTVGPVPNTVYGEMCLRSRAYVHYATHHTGAPTGNPGILGEIGIDRIGKDK